MNWNSYKIEIDAYQKKCSVIKYIKGFKNKVEFKIKSLQKKN